MKSFQKRGARVEVWRDLAEVSARGAQIFADTASDCVARRGAFMVALSGGSTPKALYTLLASDHHWSQLPWPQTHVFWSDERCVPPDDPQSNYRMAQQALLAHVAIPAEQIHRMRGEDEPSSAAAAYASLLAQEFGTPDPRFDLILLGLGDDGHTASLFPHSRALDDVEHLVAAPFVEKLRAYRLTLTLRVLNHAAKVIFLVSGAAKADALQAVLEESVEAHAWPARMVQPAQGELIWLVDEAAWKSSRQ